MEKQSYVGYHATSKQNSEKIFKYNFKFCKNGWFGTGVYFYLDKIKMAEHWLEKKGFPDKQIIKAIIEVESKFVLDVRDPNSKDSDLFHEIRKYIIELIKNGMLQLKTTQKNLDNTVFNTIMQDEDIKLIIGNSFTYDNDEVSYISKVPNATELCIGNLDIIKDKEEVYK